MDHLYDDLFYFEHNIQKDHREVYLDNLQPKSSEMNRYTDKYEYFEDVKLVCDKIDKISDIMVGLDGVNVLLCLFSPQYANVVQIHPKVIDSLTNAGKMGIHTHFAYRCKIAKIPRDKRPLLFTAHYLEPDEGDSHTFAKVLKEIVEEAESLNDVTIEVKKCDILDVSAFNGASCDQKTCTISRLANYSRILFKLNCEIKAMELVFRTINKSSLNGEFVVKPIDAIEMSQQTLEKNDLYESMVFNQTLIDERVSSKNGKYQGANKEDILSNISSDLYQSYKQLPEKFQGDHEVIMSFLRHNEWYTDKCRDILFQIPVKFKRNVEIFLWAKSNFRIEFRRLLGMDSTPVNPYGVCTSKLITLKEDAFKYCEEMGELFFECDESLHTSELIMVAIKTYPKLMYYLPGNVKWHELVTDEMLAYLLENHIHLFNDLRLSYSKRFFNPEFVLKYPKLLVKLLYVAPIYDELPIEIQESDEVIELMIQRYFTDIIGEKIIPKASRSTMMMLARYQSEWLLEHMPSVREDRELMCHAVYNNVRLYTTLDEPLQKDRDIILSAFRKSPKILEFVPEEYKDYKSLAIELMQIDGMSLMHLPEELQYDDDVLLAAIAQNRKCLIYASRQFLQRVEIALILGGLYYHLCPSDSGVKKSLDVSFSFE